ncbi:MAG TPA: class I lanthipeptide [Kofleriaceae bacterium]|jgi:hypothetical protein|nr:class I lanthipeptide [Kofleriaceae bacterium]
MNKKKMKQPLKLNRETIVQLSAQRLVQAVGGLAGLALSLPGNPCGESHQGTCDN